MLIEIILHLSRDFHIGLVNEYFYFLTFCTMSRLEQTDPLSPFAIEDTSRLHRSYDLGLCREAVDGARRELEAVRKADGKEEAPILIARNISGWVGGCAQFNVAVRGDGPKYVLAEDGKILTPILVAARGEKLPDQTEQTKARMERVANAIADAVIQDLRKKDLDKDRGALLVDNTTIYAAPIESSAIADVGFEVSSRSIYDYASIGHPALAIPAPKKDYISFLDRIQHDLIQQRIAWAHRLITYAQGLILNKLMEPESGVIKTSTTTDSELELLFSNIVLPFPVETDGQPHIHYLPSILRCSVSDVAKATQDQRKKINELFAQWVHQQISKKL